MVLNKKDLCRALETVCTEKLADELASNFMELAQDLATETLGRVSAGKFVETVVQVMQYMETGKYDSNPRVDEYLRKIESRQSSLNDSLKICLPRILRAMYSLRNKRNIAHKGEIDPNIYDLRYLFASAQWVLAEIIRNVKGLSMEEAGLLVSQIQAPVESLVEDLNNKRIVLADVTTRGEILILLNSMYPTYMKTKDIHASISRRKQNTIAKTIRQLWNEKIIEGNSQEGYVLTKKGYKEARNVISKISGQGA